MALAGNRDNPLSDLESSAEVKIWLPYREAVRGDSAALPLDVRKAFGFPTSLNK
jgi:hypothetical protein